ncbi:MAG: hypothetical protein ACI4ET_06630 [Bilifractor sp.]
MRPFKKKQKALTTYMPEEISPAFDFTERRPFHSYRNMPYRQYEPLFSTSTEVLDKELDTLLAAGALDDGNSACMDALIADLCDLAIDDLDNQRARKKDNIQQFFARFESDLTQFRSELSLAQTQYEENQAALKDLSDRYKKQKFKINQ